ncbi:unnamed protein product [Parajaminaea phylloscopi]
MPRSMGMLIAIAFRVGISAAGPTGLHAISEDPIPDVLPDMEDLRNATTAELKIAFEQRMRKFSVVPELVRLTIALGEALQGEFDPEQALDDLPRLL